MKGKFWIVTVIVIGLVGIISLFLFDKNNATGAAIGVPHQPIHWHPHLTILIDGQQQVIPAGIGLGVKEYPEHTHDTDGIIHMENNNPTSETLMLGYFFKVWGKDFSRTCIFQYCTNNGTLKMFVNGKQNLEFEKYSMHDKDEIIIEYVSKKF